MNSKESVTDLKISDIPLDLIPARKLSPGIRNKLSLLLNPPKIKETSEGIPRDYEGLGALMGFDIAAVEKAHYSGDATKYLLSKWISEDDSSIEKLLEILERMQRYDILDDITPLLERCVGGFLKFLKTDSAAREALKSLGKLSLIEENPELKIITRDEWGARIPTAISKFKSKLKLVFIHHTVIFHESSVETVRYLQTSAMDTYHETDIRFNFLINQEGEVYEGSGWDNICSQNFQFAGVSINIAFIGNFNQQKPSSQMITSLRRLVEQGIEKKRLEKQYSLMGYCDVNVSDSPGVHAMEILSTLPNYKYRKTTNVSLEEKQLANGKLKEYLRSNSQSPSLKFGGNTPPIPSV